jgi:hypothetical protein
VGGLVPDGLSGQQGNVMSTRTIQTTVTFHRPFTLSSVEGHQPAGTYRLETEEEQLDGLSFSAFRRMTMLLFLPAEPTLPGATRHVVQVDPKELSEALLADAV